ncbi:MAG: metal ABC transporter ATP-binding protein [Candidatus Gastranaerophilaceae bacterium]|jgi:zinc transport system ATP-binding protein
MKHSIDLIKSNENSCGLCCTKIENFKVTFGKTEILSDVNLHIHCGELTALIGPNGAGKSTLLKAILGEIKHSGNMHFLDMKGDRTGHPLIGYVPQYLDFDKTSPVSVLDLFTSCLTNTPVWIIKSKQVRIQVLDSLKVVQGEHLIDKRLGNLSGGELQRVLLALALVPLPDLLLLDEPVAGIDQSGLELFYAIVSELRNNYDMSIILVSHDLNLVAQYADRVVLLNKTIQMCGTPEEVLNDDRLLKSFGGRAALSVSNS